MATLVLYSPLWAAITVLLVGYHVYRCNPTRTINRTFPWIAVTIAVWQMLLLLTLTTVQPSLFLKGASSMTAIVAGIAIFAYDAAATPLLAARERPRRLTPVFAAVLLFAGFPWLSHLHLFPPAGIYRVYFLSSQFVLGMMLLRLSSKEWELRDLGILHLLYLAAICVWGASTPVGHGLNYVGRIAMIWNSSDPLSPEAVNTCSFIATVYFAVAGWTLTSHRVIRLSDVIKQQIQFLFLIPFPLAVVVPCIYFSRNWHIFNQALLVVVAGFVSMRLVPDLLRSRKLSFLRAREDAFRGEAIDAAYGRWTAASLNRDFLQILKKYFATDNVDLLILEPEFPFTSLSPNRRLLIEAATSFSGSLTREAVARRRDGNAPALLAAFEEENLCAVVTSPGRGGCATVLVGERPELPPPSWTEVKFAGEMALLYAIGVDRALVARQAMHAQQLATVGYFGSQFRHQARNQLEAIRTVLDMLHRGMEANIDPELRTLVLHEADELIGDYNMMLDLARPDYDSIQSRPLLVIETVKDAMRAFAPTAKSQSVRYESEIDPEADAVMADKRLLQHALMNLIRNAIQAVAGTPDPAVKLSVRAKGNRVEFDVSDNGPGVPSHIFQNLFTVFVTSKPNGTGLGLSICRNAITMMGGTIDYVTAPGQPHAVFRISLPRAVAEASSQAKYDQTQLTP